MVLRCLRGNAGCIPGRLQSTECQYTAADTPAPRCAAEGPAPVRSKRSPPAAKTLSALQTARPCRAKPSNSSRTRTGPPESYAPYREPRLPPPLPTLPGCQSESAGRHPPCEKTIRSAPAAGPAAYRKEIGGGGSIAFPLQKSPNLPPECFRWELRAIGFLPPGHSAPPSAGQNQLRPPCFTLLYALLQPRKFFHRAHGRGRRPCSPRCIWPSHPGNIP